MYAVSTHGWRGMPGPFEPKQLAAARSLRDILDERSPFGRTFGGSPELQQYLRTRRDVAPTLEDLDAISKLMLLDPDAIPPELGIERSDVTDDVRSTLTDIDHDSWAQQAGLAFLLAFHGLACASTISLAFEPVFSGDDITGAPLAFDFSHTAHRPAQNVMWGRVLQVVHGLITLLKKYDYLGDPALGKMWDRSLIYIATEFGRDKIIPENGSFSGTGHHLNNGSVLLSPLLQGNRIYGGVDPSTLLTYGFDLQSGAPKTGTVVREPEVYSVIAQAMQVEFPERRNVSGVT